MATPKVYIIGLPRTATTSVCVALLDLGYKTAHTAYTRAAIREAEAIADTPVFCDYPVLDTLNPKARFIYLERDISAWIPSIRRLLERMYVNLSRTDGGFNPIIKRCYGEVFGDLTPEKIADDDYLAACYLAHKEKVLGYFNERADLLRLNVSAPGSYGALLTFLAREAPYPTAGFKPINMAGKVTAWKEIRHPLKVESTRAGKADADLYKEKEVCLN